MVSLHVQKKERQSLFSPQLSTREESFSPGRESRLRGDALAETWDLSGSATCLPCTPAALFYLGALRQVCKWECSPLAAPSPAAPSQQPGGHSPLVTSTPPP